MEKRKKIVAAYAGLYLKTDGTTELCEYVFDRSVRHARARPQTTRNAPSATAAVSTAARDSGVVRRPAFLFFLFACAVVEKACSGRDLFPDPYGAPVRRRGRRATTHRSREHATRDTRTMSLRADVTGRSRSTAIVKRAKNNNNRTTILSAASSAAGRETRTRGKNNNKSNAYRRYDARDECGL